MLNAPFSRYHLLTKPAHRRRADHADSEARANAPKVKGMRAPMPAIIADLLLVGGHVDGPGAEEEGDLGEGVVGDVDHPA